MIPKMNVICNPFAKDELAPSVRFEPSNGFSIRHGNIKGAWRTNAPDAVRDFNGSVQRALGSLRLSEYKAEVFPLASLPGVDAAWQAYERAKAQAEAFKTPKDGCNCGACKDAREAAMKDPQSRLQAAIDAAMKEDAPKEDKSRLHPPKRKPGAGLSTLLAVLALSGVLGDLLDEDPEDRPQVDVDGVEPELADHLAKVGLLFVTGGGLGRAIVAIPRRMGEAFTAELEDAIRNNDLERVKRLTVGRKFN